MWLCLFPQATSESESTSASTAAAGRRRLIGVTAAPQSTPLPRRSEPCDRRPCAALLALFQDRAQAAHRPAGLAPDPAAEAERLDDPVGERRRLGLERHLDLRLAAG